MKYILSVDLDGTVADFAKKTLEVLRTPFYSMDNDLAWKLLAEKCPDLYRDLELLPDANILLDFLGNLHSDLSKEFSISILTAIPSKAIFPNVTQHKRDWVRSKIEPGLQVNFGPYSIDKQYHCQGPSHILIDDNKLCIDQWNARGGVGILHFTAESTIQALKDLGF